MLFCYYGPHYALHLIHLIVPISLVTQEWRVVETRNLVEMSSVACVTENATRRPKGQRSRSSKLTQQHMFINSVWTLLHSVDCHTDSNSAHDL